MSRQGGKKEMRKFQGKKNERELGIYSHVHRRGREICGVSSMEVMRTVRMLEAKLVVSLQQRCCSPQGPERARNAFWTLLF